MDAGDLRVFEAVARLGGMNRAALELNTVQSNVTARIRQLEDELGASLFERHSRGVTLTAAGRRLLPYAVGMRHFLDDARRAFQDDGIPRGGLIIGALETTAALRLSSSLATYVSAYPAVDLVLRTGTTEEMIADVLEHRLEGAFVCGPVDHPVLEARFAFREELVLLTAPAVRTLDELFAGPMPRLVVLKAGCSYRRRLEEILKRRGVGEPRLLEFGTIEALLACVSAGLGITLLPKELADVAARGRPLAVHALAPSEAVVETLFIRQRDAFLSSALAAFLDLTCPAAAEAAA
jgi:LysR family transcriptional regulator, cell division regulator